MLIAAITVLIIGLLAVAADPRVAASLITLISLISIILFAVVNSNELHQEH